MKKLFYLSFLNKLYTTIKKMRKSYPDEIKVTVLGKIELPDDNFKSESASNHFIKRLYERYGILIDYKEYRELNEQYSLRKNVWHIAKMPSRCGKITNKYHRKYSIMLIKGVWVKVVYDNPKKYHRLLTALPKGHKILSNWIVLENFNIPEEVKKII